MSDPFSTSRSARESLARGLNALQADASVPPQLLDLAAPIAQAMGALHQLEKNQALAPHADVALGHVRTALASLQSQPPGHPAVANALEAVAASLGMVHTLSKMANGPQPGAPAPQPQAAPAPQPQAAPAPQPQVQLAPQGVPNTTAAMPPIQQAPAAGPGATMAMSPGAAAPMMARDPFAAPAPGPSPMAGTHVAPGATQAAPQGPPPGHAPPPGQPAMGAPPGQPAGGPPPGSVITADLGAHSPTNFYKGLSGNDIIDHGGLFVSTYMIPKVGTPVRLKVSLPGGYEFEANAIVRWTREQSGDAPPGFGAQFVDITQDARQLVYRYVRNREPLFYDDL